MMQWIQSAKDILDTLFPFVAFILFWFFMWASISAVLSHLGGWAALAKSYLDIYPPKIYRWTWVNGRFRVFVNYSNCLKIDADEKGMHLAIVYMFKFMHPPLLIPWTDIREIKYGSYWFFWTELQLMLGDSDQVPIALYGSVAKEFRDIARSYQNNQTYRYDPNPATLSLPKNRGWF